MKLIQQINYIILLMLLSGVFSCEIEEPEPAAISGFSVDNHNILKEGQPFIVKGVVYVPGYPGFLPWEIERSENLPEDLMISIMKDIRSIKELGANTIRFWGAPRYCYEALNEIGGLYFLQTIWIDGETPDFQNSTFKESTKRYIKEVIDRVYSVFDKNPPVIAFLVGNELSKNSILATDEAHPKINQYLGDHIKTDQGITATEAFIAEMADYVKTYETETYGNTTLVSYSNEIRTYDLLDTPFLDFICHNAYSYAVPYYRPLTPVGSSSGSLYQGWIEEVKAQNPELPLLITETGLSISPNANNIGPPNYGYGGNTEEEQAMGLLSNINDINTSKLPLAGVCIHEYLDAWWKFGLEDSYTQDPNDIEEWFGLVELIKKESWYVTKERKSYQMLQKEWTDTN